MNAAETYLIKALDNYPWDIKEATEAIQYGLAYNAEHPALLCLMGRLCSEHLHQYKNAVSYFEEALVADLDYPETYYHYLNLLIKLEQLDEAEKLAEQAFRVPGIDKYTIYINKSGICEQREQYTEALDMITLARRHCYNKEAGDFLEEEVSRINKKIDPANKEDKEEEPHKKTFFEKLGLKKIKKK